MAFTKQGSMWVWIDTESRLLVLDLLQGRADEVVSLLVESLPGLSVSLINTQTSPQASMAHWLATQEPPVGFSIDRECELKSADEAKAVVRYARHPLDIEEIQAHIAAGKLPTEPGADLGRPRLVHADRGDAAQEGGFPGHGV